MWRGRGSVTLSTPNSKDTRNHCFLFQYYESTLVSLNFESKHPTRAVVLAACTDLTQEVPISPVWLSMAHLLPQLNYANDQEKTLWDLWGLWFLL